MLIFLPILGWRNQHQEQNTNVLHEKSPKLVASHQFYCDIVLGYVSMLI